MTPSDEQLIRTLTDLGCSREFATSAIVRDRWAAIMIHEAVQRAREGDLRSACLVDGARTMFALLTGDLKASPASSCDFDDDAVAREREAVAERRKQVVHRPTMHGWPIGTHHSSCRCRACGGKCHCASCAPALGGKREPSA